MPNKSMQLSGNKLAGNGNANSPPGDPDRSSGEDGRDFAELQAWCGCSVGRVGRLPTLLPSVAFTRCRIIGCTLWSVTTWLRDETYFLRLMDPLERVIVCRRESHRSRFTRCRIACPPRSAISACSAFQIRSWKYSLDNRLFAGAYRRLSCFSRCRKTFHGSVSVAMPLGCRS